MSGGHREYAHVVPTFRPMAPDVLDPPAAPSALDVMKSGHAMRPLAMRLFDVRSEGGRVHSKAPWGESTNLLGFGSRISNRMFAGDLTSGLGG